MRKSMVRPAWALFLTATFLVLATGPALAQEGGEAAGGHERNAFQMFFTSGDMFGQLGIIVLLIMSVIVVSLSIQAYLTNRKKILMPEENVREYEAMAEEKQYADMITKSSGDNSMFGQVLHAALSQAPQGYNAMERTVEEYADMLGTERIRRLEYLNILGAVGPMVGLFGTVYGMIVAFEAMVSAGGQPKPAALAAGVSTALVNTFWGLIVGIPAIIAAALTKNHIDATVVQIMVRAEELIARFRPAKKKPAAPAPAEKPATRRPVSPSA